MRKYLLAILALTPIFAFAQVQDCTKGVCGGVGQPASSCQLGWIYTEALSGALYKCWGYPPAWSLVTTGGFTPSGDLSGSGSSQTVVGIHGTNITGMLLN